MKKEGVYVEKMLTKARLLQEHRKKSDLELAIYVYTFLKDLVLQGKSSTTLRFSQKKGK